MMKKNYDQSVKINHNPNCIQVNPNSGKTNVIELNKNQAPDIDKNFLCVLKIHLNQTIHCLLMEEKK